MAINDAYATAIQYRQVIDKTDSAQDSEILTDLLAVSRYLEGELGRFFTQDAAAVARVFIPSQTSSVLYVGDLAAAPTSVKIDTTDDGTFDTELAATDYELLPLNADKGPEPWPFNEIGMTPWGNYSSFNRGERVEVTAQFGWPSVPGAIQRATIHLTAILRLETPRATRRIAELGDIMEASPQAQGIVNRLVANYKVWHV